MAESRRTATETAAAPAVGRPLAERIFLVAVPALVGLVLLFHPRDPAHGRVVFDLGDVTTRWLAVHVALLLLLPALAFWLFLAVRGLPSRAAWVTRVGAVPFAAFYTAFDAMVGIATGVLVREALALPPERQEGARELAEVWWTVPAPVWLFSTLGPVSWLVAAGAAALAHWRSGSSWLVVAGIAVAAPFFAFGHPLVLGPIGMLGLVVAALALGRRRG